MMQDTPIITRGHGTEGKGMVTTTAGIFIVPLIITCVLLTLLLIFAVPALIAVFRNSTTQRARLAGQRDLYVRACTRLADANATVIDEFEAHPHLYETVPDHVRDAVYAARETAAELEGKNRIEP